jgi:hypothetical protein
VMSSWSWRSQMTAVRAVVLDVRALAFVSVSASRVVAIFRLIVVFALVWPRPVYASLKPRGGDLRRGGCGLLAVPFRLSVSGARLSAHCSVRAGGTA